MSIVGFSGLYTIGEHVPVVVSDFKLVEDFNSAIHNAQPVQGMVIPSVVAYPQLAYRLDSMAVAVQDVAQACFKKEMGLLARSVQDRRPWIQSHVVRQERDVLQEV